MSTAVLPGKNRTPQTPGIVERPRLLRKLHSILEHKLMIISAPPGYGKTTLVTQFTNQSPYPVLWHLVEERERDLPNLYNHTRQVLRHALPGIDALPEAVNRSPNELAAIVADTLRENLTGPVIYIFDDLQHLAGAYDSETWLRTLIPMLPADFHLIIISRILPDLPLAEMIARREVVAIGQEELRFTYEETFALAEYADESNTPPSPDAIQKLYDHLEGWPAGTVFALYPLPQELEGLMLGGQRGPEALFDLLADSMLRAQPLRLRRFLLASSTLSRLTPELCTEALGLADTIEIFAEFQIRNLFLSRTPTGLQYHTLFRSFLQRQLYSQEPKEYTRLHVRVAHWFEQQGNIEEAFEHYISGGMAAHAAALAGESAQAYFSHGQIETILKWNDLLDRAGVSEPHLSYVCAVIYSDRYQYAAADAELNKAEASFQATNDIAGLSDIRLQRAILDLQRGNYQEAVAEAEQILDLPPELRNLHGRALKVLGVAELRLGRIEEALEALVRAVPLHRLDGDAYTLANILQDLGVAYWQTGRTAEAKACLQEVVALRRSLGGAEALALALNNLGCLYHSAGSYDLARQTFQQGLNTLTHIPHGRAGAYLLLSQGDLMRDLGAFDEARNHYRRALELLGSSEPVLHCLLLISLSTLQRWNNHPREAADIAEEALEIARHHAIAYETVAARAAYWAAQVQMEAIEDAPQHLLDLASEFRQLARLSELTQVLAICATTALAHNSAADAERFLREAIDIALEAGSMQQIVSEVYHTPKLREFAQQRAADYPELDIELKKLRADIRHIPGKTPNSSSESLISHTYSLRVHTLGLERIERNGETIAASEWRTITAQELFFYLLFEGPQARERISVVFWPDSSTKRSRSSFHTTLYRARQALGENVIDYEDGLYRVSPEVTLWCDVHDLERLTGQARLLPPRDPRTEDLWQRAVDLYHGDFLPSIDTDWVLPFRETYHEAYLEALIGLGDCARARYDIRSAVQAYKRALTIEPYREDIHRTIMKCYADIGERQLISSQLDEIRNLLQSELGIEPSDETLRLAHKLLS